jgi:ABC-2 type transport system permease protein
MSAGTVPRPGALPGGPLRHLVRSLPTLLRVGLAEMVAYRAEVVIWILTATFPLIMLAVWDRVADTGAVGGFDRGDLARYFVAVIVVRQLTSNWLVWELNDQIRTGRLSSGLLKPLHPMVLPAAECLAMIPLRIVVLVPIVALLYAWRPSMGIGFDLAHVPLLALSIALAWLLHYLVQLVFGCLAFWLDQSLGVYNAWFGLWALLSGYIVPIALMPPLVADAAQWLPFRALLGTPVEIAAGLVRGQAALVGVALQAAWVVAALLLARSVWRRGVRRYEAYGA